MTTAHVLEGLRDANPERRRRALQDLASLEPADAGPLLLVALGDADWRVRKEAALAARAMQDRAALAAIVVTALEDKANVGLRNAAVEALEALGSDAIAATTRALATLDADGRKLAVEVLGRIPDPRATSTLVRALRDADPNVRATAAEQLGHAAAAGEAARTEAIDGLAAMLAAGEPLLVLSALGALDELGAEAPWATLAPLAEAPLTRSLALRIAARSPEPGALAALGGALAHDRRSSAREAAIGLAERAVATPSRVPELRRVLTSEPKAAAAVRALMAKEDPIARAAAVVLLGVLGRTEDLGALIDTLGDPNVAERAELALSFYGRAAVGELLARAATSTPPQRASVFPIVGALSAQDAPRVRDAMRIALADPAPEVAAAAAGVLGSKGTGDDLARLATLVASADARLATAARASLVALARRHGAAAQDLLRTLVPDGPHAAAGCLLVEATRSNEAWAARALATGDARTRRAAVEALAAVGTSVARDAVTLALADEERDVRLAAVRALGRLGGVDALATLLAAPGDGDLVGAALRALGDADPDRAGALARPLVRNDDTAIACAAIDALGRWGGALREEGLFEALGHGDPGVVALAMSELARGPSSRAIARLGACLDHPEWEVRRLAAEVLGQTGHASAGELLRARLNREQDPSVREALQDALSARPEREDEG